MTCSNPAFSETLERLRSCATRPKSGFEIHASHEGLKASVTKVTFLCIWARRDNECIFGECFCLQHLFELLLFNTPLGGFVSEAWVALFSKRSPGVAGPDFFREPGRTAAMGSTAAAHGAWPQRPQRPTRSHWSRPQTRLLYAAQRTFAPQFASQHFEQLLPTRGNHRLQSPGYLCPPRARSSVCRQIVSGKNSRLSHVRPEMQSFGTHSLAATRRIPPARRRQRQDPLSAKGCINPLRKARRCRRGFIGDRVAGSVPAPDPESLRNRGQKARSTRGTRRRSSNPSGTAASRGSPPVWRRRPSNRTERAATCAAGACGA
jgi:hypothetical protein